MAKSRNSSSNISTTCVITYVGINHASNARLVRTFPLATAKGSSSNLFNDHPDLSTVPAAPHASVPQAPPSKSGSTSMYFIPFYANPHKTYRGNLDWRQTRCGIVSQTSVGRVMREALPRGVRRGWSWSTLSYMPSKPPVWMNSTLRPCQRLGSFWTSFLKPWKAFPEYTGSKITPAQISAVQ